MDFITLLQALVLGLIEGLTEFLPVSSTGHLLLAGHFMRFDNPGKTFEVLIQLGAILAILTLYFRRLVAILAGIPHDPLARRFTLGVLIAFLPAAVAGALLHDFIKGVLFETPAVIALMLIIGGVVLLVVDRLPLRPRFHRVMEYPMLVYLGIGVFQCLALVPGVSRSGATIVGALLLGTDKRSAAEFSFFLAMPTMAGAFAYDAWKNRDLIDLHEAAVVGIGFVAAFIAAAIVVRVFIDFVSRHGFTPFAWWRIVVGAAALALLWAGY
jgi:undecaprenyl-diphosphatase